MTALTHFRARAGALALATAAATACSSWTAVRGSSPQAALGTRTLHHATVRLAGGETLDLYGVTVRGDSLRGSAASGAAVAVPVDRVALVSIETLDRAATTRLGWVVGLYLTLIAMSGAFEGGR